VDGRTGGGTEGREKRAPEGKKFFKKKGKIQRFGENKKKKNPGQNPGPSGVGKKV